ncbi:acyltransferase [Octadecabacter sp.]|nr:acyltransferase [Octadecabacter sp.]
MKYRAEIDGLRALAVVPVILFHAGFELFSGGFVGVDVFFVISGYLITTILIEDIENQRFSIVNFYERRARRILPALFFVMLVCIPFAWMWMLPTQMKDFSQSLVAVSLFTSNILFWRESGYFAAAAEEKPLLHTWSLAVEEQYYVLFPIFLILAWRFGKNRVFWMIVVIAAISLILSEWGWRNKATANFYLAPTRAWELFAGSIAAFIVQKQGVQKNNFLATVGLAAIIFSIFFYDETTPFPSVYALVPVLGVVLLVLYADRETIAAKLLSTKGFVGIGLISYSAYLWHQPLFAFARIRSLEHPSMGLMSALSLISLILAYFSWGYIEKPFRDKTSIGKKSIFVFSSVGLLSFILVGYQGHSNDGYRERFNIEDTVYASLIRSQRQSECFGEDVIQRTDWFCNIGSSSSAPSFFVFGDSHSLSFLPAIDTALSENNKSGLFAGTSGCIPFLRIHSLRNDQLENNCNELNLRVFSYVKQNAIDTLLLVARWTYYTDGGYEGDDFSYIGLRETDERMQKNSRLAFEYGLRETITAYSEIGVNVIVVPQVPQQHREPLDIYAHSSVSGKGLTESSVSRSQHLMLQKYVRGLFEAESVRLLDFTDTLCDELYCSVGTKQTSFYNDDDHLSLSGSSLLIKPLVDFLSNE